MTDTPTILAVAAFASLGLFLALAAWHVWYALGLARVLQAHGAEAWRAWVPLLNDAEVLRLGRVDPVKVSLLLVPFVCVYAVVLRALAAHRINVGVGRGAGATTLAVLLPPVWAMVIAGDEPVAAASPDDDDADETPELAASGVVAVGALPPAFTPPPAAAAWAPAAPPVLAPPAAVVPPATTATPLAPAAAPVAAAPVVAAPPVAAPPVAAPPVTVVPDAGPYRRRSREAPLEAPLDDETSIASGPRAWQLVVPSGEVLPITARTVVLGRNPQSRRGEAQYVTVTDDTRTVSKEHAQLQWAGGAWSISDLGSVNGISLVDGSGVEQPVSAASPVPVSGDFFLGAARFSLRRADDQ
ncbi:FHA domain-containing protein [Microbacterium sp. P06]|uniref:FHA domain-containing protein n=1 Tax=Microbacterium sp. P06 TaxID=3366949 RepID=UPI00374717F6